MKNWLNLILCVLLSGSIWLIYNLSQTYSAVVDVTVNVESDLEGYARRSFTQSVVSARVTASGFSILDLNLSRKKARTVFVPSSELTPVGDGSFNFTRESVTKHSSDFFGESIITDAVLNTNFAVRFNSETYKKVPVRPVLFLEFDDQYTAVEQPTFTPDSVLIYGEPSRLENIEAVLTRVISHKNISRSIRGTVKLDIPGGLRLSTQEVGYELKVSRFVRIESQARVIVKNAPAGETVSVVPSTVKLFYDCVFPLVADPLAKAPVFYVSYEEFSKSITGHCAVRWDRLPEGVIRCSVDPEICDCFLISDNSLDYEH